MKNVVIADDHPIVVEGIQNLLQDQVDFKVIGCFNTGKALLQSTQLAKAQLVLLDLNMPELDGLYAIRQINDMGLPLKIVVITSYVSSQLAEECRKYDVAGYLVKSNDLKHLLDYLRRIANGEVIYPDFDRALGNPEEDRFSYFDDFLKKYQLTKREVEIIKLICKDHSSQRIAERLHISIFTVQTHRKNIIRKLQLDDSRIALYRFAEANGLI